MQIKNLYNIDPKCRIQIKSQIYQICGLYYKSFMIVNYTSVCSVAYHRNLPPQLMILAKVKLGLYCKLQS